MKKLLVVGILLFVTGCNVFADQEITEEAKAYKQNFEIIGKEKEALIGDIHPDIFEPAIEEKQSEEANVLFIDHKADKPYQVPTGRYSISGEGTGYIYLYDGQENLVYQEFIAYGIESVEVDIKDDYDFRFNGLERVALVEVEPEVKEVLSPGIWEVGIHIDPGVYKVSGEGYGYLKLLSNQGDHQLFEFLGSAFTETEITIEFSEKEKVIITGLSEVVLELVQ